MFKWFKYFKISLIIDKFRGDIQVLQLSNWVIYSLPNGLWSFSIASFVFIFNSNKKYIHWSYIFFSLIIIPEIFQKFNSNYGTFDFIDLLTNIIFFALGFIINSIYRINRVKIGRRYFNEKEI